MPKLKPTDTELAFRVVKACITGNQELYAVDDNPLSIKAGIRQDAIHFFY